jgi:nicotinic acid mononucleotide adenylyltransferase
MWRSLDVDAPAAIVWPRQPSPRVLGQRVVVQLGAFDPMTNAHQAILEAVRERGVPVIGLTKILLARESGKLLDDEQRVEVLDLISHEGGYGFAMANRGTYLDVHRALRADGFDASFVVGADKLDQLADPSFYPDGPKGVEATFREVSFLVVPRSGFVVTRPEVVVLPESEVFSDPIVAGLSATRVREMVARGERIDDLVPPRVAAAIGGYTSAR